MRNRSNYLLILTVVLLILILLTIAGWSLAYHVSWAWIIRLNLVSPISTILVGMIAYYIYSVQKRDFKINAAKIIFMEICEAEKKIQEVKTRLDKNPTIDDYYLLISIDGWRQNKYLFINDLVDNELSMLDNFYLQCRVFDEFLMRQINIIPRHIDYRLENLQRIIADIAKETALIDADDKTDKKKIYKEKIRKFTDMFIGDDSPYTYTPRLSETKIRECLSALSPISTTSIGIKLKQIARV